jgi:hypothetical protein
VTPWSEPRGRDPSAPPDVRALMIFALVVGLAFFPAALALVRAPETNSDHLPLDRPSPPSCPVTFNQPPINTITAMTVAELGRPRFFAESGAGWLGLRFTECAEQQTKDGQGDKEPIRGIAVAQAEHDLRNPTLRSRKPPKPVEQRPAQLSLQLTARLAPCE